MYHIFRWLCVCLSAFTKSAKSRLWAIFNNWHTIIKTQRLFRLLPSFCLSCLLFVSIYIVAIMQIFWCPCPCLWIKYQEKCQIIIDSTQPTCCDTFTTSFWPDEMTRFQIQFEYVKKNPFSQIHSHQFILTNEHQLFVGNNNCRRQQKQRKKEGEKLLTKYRITFEF